MLTSDARVATDRASRYLAQLCKHFAHKAHTEWDDVRGFADFGWGRCTLTATPDALLLHAEAPDPEGLGRVEYVVGDHASRFGARDNLTVDWARPAQPAR
ncbi:DUF2218 domain-containing protein [Micromonospora sp. NPDC049679]|uniref:DUF2218 domain-containing protein n=1 Tax=Micromonospora sp. NPDC049679 TaxID=3155920 RepID=UPI0033C5411C